MTIPKGIAFSPKTLTLGVTSTDAVVIGINTGSGEGVSAFPTPSTGRPGQATLSQSTGYTSEDPDTYETVYFTAVGSSELTGVTRGVEGVVQEWPSGTVISVQQTDAQIEAIIEKVLQSENSLKWGAI
jgi:hypothetical protein